MIIRLYFDEDSMRHALVHALRARGIDVQTALDVGMIERSDEDHLRFATAQGRVLCSFNVGDFYRLHTDYMAQHQTHTGIILTRQQQYPVGEHMRHKFPSQGTACFRWQRNVRLLRQEQVESSLHGPFIMLDCTA